MSRPGFVLEVDDRTPPLLVHEGEGFRLENFPLGTRVVYPPESLPAVRDVDGAIREALLHPVDSDPLPDAAARRDAADDRLRRHLAAAAADARARHPAADHRAGADDGRRRRRRRRRADRGQRAAPADDRRPSCKHIVGERVFRSFFPQGLLYNHDAEDRDNLLHIGLTDQGEDVEINRRAAESDLLVYVNVNLVADGRRPQVGADRAGVVQVAAAPPQQPDDGALALVHGPHQVRTCTTPPGGWAGCSTSTSRSSRSRPRSTTTSSRRRYDFLMKREWEWSVKDQASMLGDPARRSRSAPKRLRHKIFHDLRAPYGLTGVNAGETEAVHERTIANVHRQQLVEVQGQSDVLVMGVPYLGPYNVNSAMNPILATCMGLGYFFNSYRGQPVVRQRRRGDPLPPARRRSSTSCTTRATSTSSRRSSPSRPTRR